MKNFQDVLQQMNLPYGSLWSDKGVYHIGKELQLLNPDQFGNIFLGLGLYLQNSGIKEVTVENEISGPVGIKSILSGADYALGKRGMSLIAKTVGRLYIKALDSFGKVINYKSLDTLFSMI